MVCIPPRYHILPGFLRQVGLSSLLLAVKFDNHLSNSLLSLARRLSDHYVRAVITVASPRQGNTEYRRD